MCLPPNWIRFLIRFTAEPQTSTSGELRGPCTAGGKMKQAGGKGWKGDTRSQNWCWRLNLVKPQLRSSSQEKVSSCWPALFFLTLQSPLWTLSWPWGDCSPQLGKLCPRLAIQAECIGTNFPRNRNFPSCWHTNLAGGEHASFHPAQWEILRILRGRNAEVRHSSG